MNSDSKIVKQPRAMRTRAKLLEALERLLADREFEQVAIADIAKEAGVAVGSVYSHFADKRAFLEALLEKRLVMVAERLEEAAADETAGWPDTLAAAVDLAVRSAFAQVKADAHIIRALHTYARLSGTGHPRGEEVAGAAFRGVAAFLDHYRDEMGVADTEEAARIVNYMLNTVFLDRVLIDGGSLPAGIAPDEEALLTALSAMLTAWLKGGTSAA